MATYAATAGDASCPDQCKISIKITDSMRIKLPAKVTVYTSRTMGLLRVLSILRESHVVL